MNQPSYRHLSDLGIPYVGTAVTRGMSRWALRCYAAADGRSFTVCAVEVDEHHRALRREFDGAVRIDATPPTADEFYDEAHDWLEVVADAHGWRWALAEDGAA